MITNIFSLYLKKRWKQILTAQKNPLLSQEKAYQHLRRQMKGTKIFEEYYESYPDYASFVHAGEVHRYKDFEGLIKRTISSDETNALFSDSLKFIGLSSGTTAQNSKNIPVNLAMLNVFKSFQLDLAAVLEAHTDLKLLRDNRLTWGSTALVEKTESGIPCGYISGFLATQTPRLVRGKNFPNQKTHLLQAMKEKIAATSLQVKEKDIQLLAGVPTYLIHLLEELKKTWGVSDFSRVWPHLKTILYSATPIEPYRKQLETLIGNPLQFLGCYCATEGPIGYEIPSIQRGVYAFHLGNLIYNFKKLGEEHGPLLAMNELAAGDEVELLISSPNGLTHYSMGDCLRICSVKPFLTFEIIGRVGQGLNVATEKVQVSELQKAVAEVSRELHCSIEHFFVFPGKNLDGKPCYEWILLTPPEKSLDLLKANFILDQTLMKLNPDYEEVRMKTCFLGSPVVKQMSSEIKKIYFQKEAHRGQLKMKTAFDSKEKFQMFMTQNLGVAL